MIPGFFFRQLSHPSGIFAPVVGRLMNRFNAQVNAFAVRKLELAPSDRVLEIGFGGGVTLPSLGGTAAFVGGVDHSPEIIGWAQARCAKAVQAGRADFRLSKVEAIPFETASFGKVCTVNTIYFWRSLDAGFAEIHRVLAPGGCLVLGFLPKEWMDRMGPRTDVFTSRAPEEVLTAASAAGFVGVHIERPDPATKWAVMVATR